MINVSIVCERQMMNIPDSLQPRLLAALALAKEQAERDDVLEDLDLRDGKAFSLCVRRKGGEVRSVRPSEDTRSPRASSTTTARPPVLA